jgi:hypothetical protein
MRREYTDSEIQAELVQIFEEKLAHAGYDIHPLVTDRHWHPVNTTDKPGKQKGSYIISAKAATFKRWDTDEKITATVREALERLTTQAEQARSRVLSRNAAKQAKDALTPEEEPTPAPTEPKPTAQAPARKPKPAPTAKPAPDKDTLAAMAAKAVSLIWQAAKPATEHPYTTKKGVNLYGLRTYKNTLVIPMCRQGKIVDLQFIDARGNKRYKKHVLKKGSYCLINPDNKPLDLLILCEGYATGASIYEALELPVVVCFDAGNLAPVLESIKTTRPETLIYIFADNDAYTVINGKPSNKGLETAFKLQAKYPGVMVVFPQFEDISRLPKDFNDLHQLEGLDAVRKYTPRQIKTVYFELLPGEKLGDERVLTFLRLILDAHTDIEIVAPPGSGKSTLFRNVIPRLYPDRSTVLTEPTRLLADGKANDLAPNEDEARYVLKAGNFYNGAKDTVSTYDSLAKIPDCLWEQLICGIDESHELTPAMGYRAKTVKMLKDRIARAWKRIYLTGTPLPFANYTADVQVVFTRQDAPIPLRRMFVEDYRAELFALLNAGERPLVWCFGRDTCEENAEFFRQAGFPSVVIHSKIPDYDPAKRQLILQQKISEDVKIGFCTSYLAEGVDMNDHPFTCLVIVNRNPNCMAAPWLIKQLFSRDRRQQMTGIYLIEGLPENRSHLTDKPFNVTAKKAALYTCAAQEACRRRNAPEEFDLSEETVNNLMGRPKGLAAEGRIDIDYLNYLLLEEYTKTLWNNPDFEKEELSQYFQVEDVADAGHELALVDLEALSDIKADIRAEKEQAFQADLTTAIETNDFETTEAGQKFARLAAILNPILAVQILLTIGKSAAKYNQALLQALLYSYEISRNVSCTRLAALDALLSLRDSLRCSTKYNPSLISGEQAYEYVSECFALHPALRHLITSLKHTCFCLSKNTAIRTLRGLFDMRRVKATKDKNGKRPHRWELCGNNPLARYEDVPLPENVGHILKNITIKTIPKCGPPPTSPLERLAEEFDDWTQSAQMTKGGQQR